MKPTPDSEPTLRKLGGLFFLLRLNLLLLLHRRLRLYRLSRQHLPRVELFLSCFEITGPIARHVVELLAMNIWLHKQVMRKLAENGGKVPDDLKH
jgi:Domain of unknown function (DUF3597)